MTAPAVLVYAFDPVEELGGASGLLGLPAQTARRLIAEHRVEEVAPHVADALRFVAGSPAHEAARQALRDARGEARGEALVVKRGPGRPRKVA